MTKDKQAVIKKVKENNVKFIRFWFTDILGVLKSFAITPSELEVALEEGMGFDGSSIHGFARIDESDMIAMPDPSTFAILPWRKSEKGNTARMFCDVNLPDGTPYVGDPRNVLKSVLKKAADFGYTYYVGPELEYFYFKDNGPNPTPIDKGGYFDLTALDAGSDLRRDTVQSV
jgi:glutamine synthetase